MNTFGIRNFVKSALMTALATGAIGMLCGATAKAGSVELPTVQGHFQASGNFHYLRTDASNSDFSVAPGLEYFIVDRISVGAGANLDWNKANDVTSFSHSLSPMLTWYFLDLNPIELFVHQTVDFGVASKNSHPTGFSTSLGGSIFFNKYVAFAPEITWHYGSQVQGYWDLNGMFQTFF